MMYKPKEEKGQKRGIERKWAEAKAESVRRGQEKIKVRSPAPFFFKDIFPRRWMRLGHLNIHNTVEKVYKKLSERGR
jgi:hypothetical protein